MKTIFTLLASFFILSISAFATDNRPSGALFVKSTDRGDVRVVMDGKRFKSDYNSVMIRDVEAGLHNVKIYHQKNFGLFSLFVKKFQLVYTGILSVRPGTQVSITIDRFGRTNIDEQNIWGDQRRGGDDDDHSFDRDENYRDQDGNDRIGNNDGYGGYKYSQAINDRDFDFILQSIQKEWFENNKVESARQIITTNYFTSEQVKRMLQLFNFENNKLELAKLAYKKTVDPQNYQCVFGVLSFSSSKTELSRYIHDCR